MSETHTQHVARSAETGEYAKSGSDPKATYETDEEHKSAWRKEAERLLDILESCGSENSVSIDQYTIALVIHCQVLKRNAD